MMFDRSCPCGVVVVELVAAMSRCGHGVVVRATVGSGVEASRKYNI